MNDLFKFWFWRVTLVADPRSASTWIEECKLGKRFFQLMTVATSMIEVFKGHWVNEGIFVW
jgi:hypothetical protein